MPSCLSCKNNFEITAEDLKFYQKLDVPPPRLCPSCRLQRRMAFRNERSFYRRQCDKCKKNIISIYSDKVPHPVYCSDCWWGDLWDPLEYGQDFDFNRQFFEQFFELFNKVPQLFMISVYGENADYSNYGFKNKNCYLLIASDYCEDCHFDNYLWYSKDCLDCMFVTNAERCYELMESHNCYHCLFSRKLENCNDCAFCFDMKGCDNCFGCAGLRHKSYCFENEQLDKKTYQDRLREFVFTREKIDQQKEKLGKLSLTVPHLFANLINCENCTGDNLKDSKNSQECFDSYGLEDCKFIANGPGGIKDCYDFCGAKVLELSYEGISTGEPGIRLRFSNHAWSGCADNAYCSFSIGLTNSFGCVCLKHKEYCILNKQYSKEEYEKLMPKIIEHMKTPQGGGEWGEYFPIAFSPFAYNKTVAYDYYPLTKEEVLKRGWKWEDEKNELRRDENMSAEIITCEQCQKQFRLITQELKFYKQNDLASPSICPNCRHKNRMQLRNPMRLWPRQCAKCGAKVESTYSKDCHEIIYCENCYLQSVY